MPSPPLWLVEWTQYAALLIGTIAAIRALWQGGTILAIRAKDLRAKKS